MQRFKSLLYIQQIYNNFSNSPKIGPMRNDFTSSFPSFFLPLGPSEYTILQLSTYRPINSVPNQENGFSKTCALQSGDGKGKWTFEQQKQYLLFLKENMEEMRQKSTRKSNKIFLKMSHLVKTRTADQCRSHHQKVLKYHLTLEEIIRYYTEDVYSFQKIFGNRHASEKKQHETKTVLQQQNCEAFSIKLEESRFKISINANKIDDY